jgi:aminopeptidase-like protein
MNNLKVVNLFSLNVYTSYLENINNDIILNEIKEHSGSIPDVKNAHPAHTFYEDRTFPFEKSECKKLFK